MQGELLHGARHRGGEGGEVFALGGLGEFLPGLVALEVRLGLAFAQGAPGFCQVGGAGLFGFRQGGLGFLVAGLLGGQVAL